MQIKKSDYEKILKQVQTFVSEAQNKITRNKLEMAWKIGRLINKSLPKNRSDEYGKNLITQLERDTSISKQVLYKMRSFYQTYPKLPKDDPKLNWSHYRVLSGIKEKNERQALEDLTRENSWSSDELQKEKALFEKEGGSAQGALTGDLSSKPTSLKSPSAAGAAPPSFSKRADKIKPTRGKLATYKIIEVIGSDKKFFDCGFGIFREVKEVLPRGANIVLMKEPKIVKSSAKPQQTYTYKAYLKRVVDGDTIHANIDLGFGIFHEEIIRLAKINADEAKTDAGKKATAELQKIFDSVPFFVLKSIKTDIYNRYVCDIFLPRKKETDLQKIADTGIYLNQLLLDRGLAEVF